MTLDFREPRVQKSVTDGLLANLLRPSSSNSPPPGPRPPQVDRPPLNSAEQPSPHPGFKYSIDAMELTDCEFTLAERLASLSASFASWELSTPRMFQRTALSCSWSCLLRAFRLADAIRDRIRVVLG